MADGQGRVGMYDELQAMLSKEAPTQGALLSMMAEVEQGLTSEGWDQPPLLFTLHGDWLDESHYAVVAQLIGPIPEEASELGGDGIALFLRVSAANINTLADKPWRDTIDAFLLVTEGWMVVSTEEDFERTKQQAYEHTINQRPDKKEVRILVAADRRGATYSVTRVRDGDLMGRFDPVLPEEDDGQITEAIRMLTGSLGGPRARR